MPLSPSAGRPPLRHTSRQVAAGGRTRQGANHGFWLQQMLEREGIEIMTLSGDLDSNSFAWLARLAVPDWSRSISIASRHGMTEALMRGQIPHFSRPPFGTDRLYMTS